MLCSAEVDREGGGRGSWWTPGFQTSPPLLLALDSDIKYSDSGESFKFSGTLVVSASKAAPRDVRRGAQCPQ